MSSTTSIPTTAPQPVVTPHIQLAQSVQNRVSNTQFMTINGRVHLVFISSKTTDGKTHYHSLDQDTWKKVIPCAQRVLLTNERAHIKHRSYTNLTTRDIRSVEIPLNDASAPIRYQRMDDTFLSLSASEMDPLNGANATHNVMQELRETFINPNQVTTPYLGTLSVRVTDSREQALANYARDYPAQYAHIHNLHTSLDKDISEQTFDFYVQELLANNSFHKHPITKASSFDLTTIDMRNKSFIPIKLSEKDALIGIFVDPENNQVFVYNATEDQIKLSKNPELRTILNELKRLKPGIRISYSQAEATKGAPKPSQPHRHLVLFLTEALASSINYKKFHLRNLKASISSFVDYKRYPSLHKKIQESMQKKSNQLADEIQARYNRHYERLSVLGHS